MKLKKNRPINKQLAEKYGGKWTHIPFHGIWFCDELNLHANYVFEGGYDIEGLPMPENPIFPKGLYVYGLKTGPEKFYPNQVIKPCKHEEVMRQGDGFIYSVCSKCGEELD